MLTRLRVGDDGDLVVEVALSWVPEPFRIGPRIDTGARVSQASAYDEPVRDLPSVGFAGHE